MKTETIKIHGFRGKLEATTKYGYEFDEALADAIKIVKFLRKFVTARVYHLVLDIGKEYEEWWEQNSSDIDANFDLFIEQRDSSEKDDE